MSFSAMAQEATQADSGTLPEQFWQFPKVPTKTVDGANYRCFNLDEYKTLARIYQDYKSLWRQARLMSLELSNVDRQLKLRMEEVTLWKELSTDLDEDRKFLSSALDDEYESRLKLEKSQRFRTNFLWGVIVVESLALAVLGTVAYTAK